MSEKPENIFNDIAQKARNQINPYVNELLEATEQQSLPVIYGNYLKNKKGRWQNFFQDNKRLRPKKIYLEIGIHKGKVFSKMAQDHLHDGFLGIDITYKRCILSAKKIKASNIKNAHIIQGDAQYLDNIFAPEELDGIIVFFPDPWNKKRKQINNRLLSKVFCKKLLTIVKKTGLIWIKTDCYEYNSYICENMTASFASQVKTPFFTNHYESTFEQRFRKQNMPIYQSCWKPTN